MHTLYLIVNIAVEWIRIYCWQWCRRHWKRRIYEYRIGLEIPENNEISIATTNSAHCSEILIVSLSVVLKYNMSLVDVRCRDDFSTICTMFDTTVQLHSSVTLDSICRLTATRSGMMEDPSSWVLSMWFITREVGPFCVYMDSLRAQHCGPRGWGQA